MEHYVQESEEFLIKLGTVKKVDLQNDFNGVFDEYELKRKEKGCEELIFKTEKNKVLIYGIRKIV